MITKAQTRDIRARIAALRSEIIGIADGLRDHLDTAGSRHAQRVLRCGASDLDIAESALRLEADQDGEVTSPGLAAAPSTRTPGKRVARQPIPVIPLIPVVRAGFILRAAGSSRHFFSSYIKGEMQYVEDRDHAWFTESRDVASAMVLDLALRADQEFEITPHTHE